RSKRDWSSDVCSSDLASSTPYLAPEHQKTTTYRRDAFLMFRRQGLRHRRALRLRRCPCRRAPPSGGRSGTILYTKPMPNDTTQPQKPAKKSRRPSLVTIALVLLMLAGLGVLLYPTISDQFARWQAVQEIAQYNQVAEAEQADYSDLWAAAEAYNRRLAETGTFTGSVLNEDAADLQDVSQYLN